MEAGWVIPVDGPPVASGGVLMGPEGRIAAVGPGLAPPPDARRITLPHAVLLPGLVNVHTHLELTGFPPSAEGAPFAAWISALRRAKQARSPEEYREAARIGLRECWAGGVTTIADTGDSGAVLEVLAADGGSGVVYHEVFGPHPDQLEPGFTAYTARMTGLVRLTEGRRVRLGASPHAPYSVSGPLYARIARWARDAALPLALHLAESRAEADLVARGTGPFAEAWRARGIPLPQDGRQLGAHAGPAACRSPTSWVGAHGVLGRNTLCIHAIELDDADVSLLAAAGAAVAHCPVSNRAHGHAAAPLAKLRAAGVRIGLGTDSAASIGRLDLFRDARAARALGGLRDPDALALATLEGARALGLEREIGSLTPGKWGDCIAVQVDGAAPADPVAAVLAAGPPQVRLTVLGGRVVHRRPPLDADTGGSVESSVP